MRTILFILQKEFIQIFRDKTMLPIIFIMPVLQLIILVHAATFDMKKIDMMILDSDMSSTSRELINKFDGSPFFYLEEGVLSVEQAKEAIARDKSDIVLVIPSGFEKKLVRENDADIQLLINAINSNAASLIYAYSSGIINDYHQHIVADWINVPHQMNTAGIRIKSAYWFNPELNYKFYMVPGMLVILVTIVGMFLTALNIVREKEMGTIEQINVTPIRKYQFLTGKLTPLWCIAMFELAFGLLIGRWLFNVPIEGSLFALFGFAAVYLLVALGIGLFISTISESQQQVMFITFFFMLTFILMSGIFTPVESMPEWAQRVNIINPFAYFMRVIRMILLKGSGIQDVLRELASLLIYASAILSLAIWRYRKVA